MNNTLLKYSKQFFLPLLLLPLNVPLRDQNEIRGNLIAKSPYLFENMVIK